MFLIGGNTIYTLALYTSMTTRLEKMIDNTIVLLDNLAITFDFDLTRSKSKVNDSDRKLEIAIKTAEEIVDRYEYVQHINRQAYLGDRNVRMELKIFGNTDLPPLRPRYKYWSDFSPEAGIEVLHVLETYADHERDDRIARLIEKLEVILAPFRVQPMETIPTPSLGLRSYEYSSYGKWISTYERHRQPYKVWSAMKSPVLPATNKYVPPLVPVEVYLEKGREVLLCQLNALSDQQLSEMHRLFCGKDKKLDRISMIDKILSYAKKESSRGMTFLQDR